MKFGNDEAVTFCHSLCCTFQSPLGIYWVVVPGPLTYLWGVVVKFAERLAFFFPSSSQLQLPQTSQWSINVVGWVSVRHIYLFHFSASLERTFFFFFSIWWWGPSVEDCMFKVIKVTTFFLFILLCELPLKLHLNVFKAIRKCIAVDMGRWEHQFFSLLRVLWLQESPGWLVSKYLGWQCRAVKGQGFGG